MELSIHNTRYLRHLMICALIFNQFIQISAQSSIDNSSSNLIPTNPTEISASHPDTYSTTSGEPPDNPTDTDTTGSPTGETAVTLAETFVRATQTIADITGTSIESVFPTENPDTRSISSDDTLTTGIDTDSVGNITGSTIGDTTDTPTGYVISDQPVIENNTET
eukprot:731213_1